MPHTLRNRQDDDEEAAMDGRAAGAIRQIIFSSDISISRPARPIKFNYLKLGLIIRELHAIIGFGPNEFRFYLNLNLDF